jgi:hypothetical protein
MIMVQSTFFLVDETKEDALDLDARNGGQFAQRRRLRKL